MKEKEKSGTVHPEWVVGFIDEDPCNTDILRKGKNYCPSFTKHCHNKDHVKISHSAMYFYFEQVFCGFLAILYTS